MKLSLVIDGPLLEPLNIDADTPLEITTNGEALIITPVRDKKRRQDFEAALEKADRQYGRMLKNLAGWIAGLVSLTLARVIEIHRDQMCRCGGSPGTRDLDLLKPALTTPRAGMGGQYIKGSGLRKRPRGAR
ncbi:MAG: hypothetical protein H5T73_01420 [Actinobacteria bacterium]|nr:hypothetical protein [Actinomycetota bacterium]